MQAHFIIINYIDGSSKSFVRVLVNNCIITCIFENRQDTTEKSCIVEYGPCEEPVNQIAQANSTLADPYLVKIQLDSELSSYCYTVNASNSTFTVFIEGNITKGMCQDNNYCGHY